MVLLRVREPARLPNCGDRSPMHFRAHTNCSCNAYAIAFVAETLCSCMQAFDLMYRSMHKIRATCSGYVMSSSVPHDTTANLLCTDTPRFHIRTFTTIAIEGTRILVL
jgi:hypothetical protein